MRILHWTLFQAHSNKSSPSYIGLSIENIHRVRKRIKNSTYANVLHFITGLFYRNIFFNAVLFITWKSESSNERCSCNIHVARLSPNLVVAHISRWRVRGFFHTCLAHWSPQGVSVTELFVLGCLLISTAYGWLHSVAQQFSWQCKFKSVIIRPTRLILSLYSDTIYLLANNVLCFIFSSISILQWVKHSSFTKFFLNFCFPSVSSSSLQSNVSNFLLSVIWSSMRNGNFWCGHNYSDRTAKSPHYT